MPLFFEVAFSTVVISQNESTGGGQGECCGWLGSRMWVKAHIQIQRARPQGIMLQILLIMLFRISLKNPPLCTPLYWNLSSRLNIFAHHKATKDN